ncbi:Fc receptor-like protein 5 [Xenopus laevis]|uniref:Fc receptor-like protein 5 n=1 Tax=Xenopus laevis TaxID=8355 RepID=A0A8J1L645_XENLA|nr:Fc receptor-like protein 5 [Xenopus laevis]
MELSWGLSLCVLLLSALGAVFSIKNVQGDERQSVTLSVNLRVNLFENQQIMWYFNTNTPVAFETTNSTPSYIWGCTGRCTLFENATLQMDNLIPANQGNYTLTIMNWDTGSTVSGSVYLTVQRTFYIQHVQGIEGQFVTLCVKLNVFEDQMATWYFNKSNTVASESTNSTPTYYWGYDGRCTLFENATLQLDSLTPADQGNYSLTIMNWNTASSVSGWVYLTIESPLTPPTLKVNVSTTNGNTYPVNGTIVSLCCDAGDQNVINYTFYHDGVTACSQPHVTCNKNYLYFQPITMSDTGRYTCKIENPISSNTSQPLSIIVTVPVSGVVLSSNASSELLWAGKDSVNLTCSALGTNVTFSWYLDGAPLPPDSSYDFMDANSSLIVSPVERTDYGSFICIGSNSLNSDTSNTLTLNLGWSPDENIQCNAVESNQTVTLNCSWPGGNPAANVTMIFQNTVQIAQDTVTIDVPLIAISSGAQLTCLGAQEGQITVSTMILGSCCTKISPGGTVAIVFGVLLVLVPIELARIYFICKKNNNNTPTPTNPVYENAEAQMSNDTPTRINPAYENAKAQVSNGNNYDHVIISSEGTMAKNRPQESSYQVLQFPHIDLYSSLRKTPK